MDLKELITNTDSIEESVVIVTFDDFSTEEYTPCSDEEGWFFMAGGMR